MILPLTPPPPGYVSLAPYMVTFEWSDGRCSTWFKDHLLGAMTCWWADPIRPDEDSPQRRVMIDARGVIVLGMHGLGQPLYATDEMFERLGEWCPRHAEGMFTF